MLEGGGGVIKNGLTVGVIFGGAAANNGNSTHLLVMMHAKICLRDSINVIWEL